MNNDSKKYYQNLRLFIPICGKNEKNLFENIKIRINELNEANPCITYKQICDELGDPKEVSSEYFYNADTDYLIKKLQIIKYIRRAFISFVIMLIVVTGVHSYFYYHLYQECKNEIVIYDKEYID